MLNPFPFKKLADGVPGSREKLARSKRRSLVDMQKPMLDIMPQEMKINFVRFSCLSAMIAVMALKLVVAVLANDGHVGKLRPPMAKSKYRKGSGVLLKDLAKLAHQLPDTRRFHQELVGATGPRIVDHFLV